MRSDKPTNLILSKIYPLQEGAVGSRGRGGQVAENGQTTFAAEYTQI